MWPVSDEFRAALHESHTPVFAVEVYSSGLRVDASLDVVAGSVQVDATSSVRRTASLTLVDPTGDLTPDDANDLLAPFGNEIRLYRGLALPGGDELVPLWVFRTSRPQISYGPEGATITIQAYDRSRRVARNRFTDTVTIPAGTNYGLAIQLVVATRYPGLSYDPADFSTVTDETCPALVQQTGDDPWAFCLEMAEAIGCEVFFDPDGTCVLRPVPDPDTADLVDEYVEGLDAKILSADKVLDDERGFNAVIATGEGSNVDPPVRGEASDNNPDSPTWVEGPYGRVPFFYSSPLITTTALARHAARGQLRKKLGATEDVQFTALVNPALEAGDAVRIRSEGARVDARYVLDSFNVPLSYGGVMSATTRRRAL